MKSLSLPKFPREGPIAFSPPHSGALILAGRFNAWHRLGSSSRRVSDG
jgi:hypothetical protein